MQQLTGCICPTNHFIPVQHWHTDGCSEVIDRRHLALAGSESSGCRCQLAYSSVERWVLISSGSLSSASGGLSDTQECSQDKTHFRTLRPLLSEVRRKTAKSTSAQMPSVEMMPKSPARSPRHMAADTEAMSCGHQTQGTLTDRQPVSVLIHLF